MAEADGLYASRMARLSMVDPPIPFSTRIPRALKARVEEHAVKSGCAINDVVIRALETYLAKPRVTVPVSHERKMRT